MPRKRLVALILIVAAPFARAADASYETLLAQGKKLAAEQSWALARDAFQQALARAADDDARRWSQLWLADATWRADRGADRRWDSEWRQRHSAALDALLEPYAKDQRARDALWLAAKHSRADLRDQSWNQESAWQDRLDILDHLADLPPTPPNADAHRAQLRTCLDSINRAPGPMFLAHLSAHVGTANRAAHRPDDRAWTRLAMAQLGTLDPTLTTAEQTARWQDAVTTAATTRWEARARAEHLVFRAETWDTSDASTAASADFPALRAELERTAQDLEAAPRDTQSPLIKAALKRFAAAWAHAQLSVSMAPVLRPAQRARLAWAATGHREVTLELYQHTLESWLSRGSAVPQFTLRSDDPSPAGPHRPQVPPPPSGARRIHVAALPQTGAERHTWNSSVHDLPTLRPGFYSVRLAGHDGTNHSACLLHFIVTDLRAALVVPRNQGASLVVSHAETGAAIAHAQVTGLAQINATDQRFAGGTDSAGILRIPAWHMPAHASALSQLAAIVGDQPVEVSFVAQAGTAALLHAELIFDRPLYRRGETVRWKLIARERRPGAFALPRGQLALTLHGPSDEEPLLENNAITLNAFGTASGQFTLPWRCAAGRVHASLRRADAASEEHASVAGAFSIDEFVAPTLVTTLELASDPDSLRPGRLLTVTAQVSYFSGGPAAAVPVTCRFTTNRNPAQAPELRGVTDATGRATFRFPLRSDLPEASTINVVATALPEGGQPAEAVAEVVVTVTGALIQQDLDETPSAVRPGEPFAYVARILDGARRPRALAGTAQLVENRWIETWLNPQRAIATAEELADARRKLGVRLPPPWRRLHAGPVETIVATSDFAADRTGLARVSFTPPRAGRYEVRLLREGQRLRQPDFTSSRAIVAASESVDRIELPPDEALLAAPARIVPRGKFTLLVVLPEGESSALLSIVGEDSAETRRIDLRGRAGWIDVDRPPRSAKHLLARLHPLRADAFSPREHHIRTEDSSDELRVILEPDRRESRPGETVSVALAVRDPEGQARAAELAVFGSDEAVNRLVEPEPDRVPEFWDFHAELPQGVFHSVDLPDSPEPKPLPDPRIGRAVANTLNHSVRLDAFAVGAGSAMAAQPALSPPGAAPPITLRRHFSATAFWAPEVRADPSGRANVTFTYPDNLTEWRLTAYAVTPDGQRFGRSQVLTRTTLPFQARLQAPRFLVAGDSAEISALLVNRTAAPHDASATLSAAGALELTPADGASTASRPIAAQGEARLTWHARAPAPGAGVLRLTARASREGDAMEITTPVIENGIQQQTSASGRLAREQPAVSLTLPLPDPLDRSRTRVRVLVSPGHAALLLDALPYLVDYPYGCVEQTMSRFLPAVAVRSALRAMGLDAEAVERRMLVQESKRDARRRARTAGLAKLDDVVAQGLSRLAQAQLPGGGYGWWPGQSAPDPWMTAYVAWGLTIAHEAGVELPRDLVSGDALLKSMADLADGTDNLAWTLAALTRIAPHIPNADRDLVLPEMQRHFERAFAARDRLSVAGLACLAGAAKLLGSADQRAILLRNLANGAIREQGAGSCETVHWGRTRDYWRAMEGAVETTALTLLALLDLEPNHPLVAPAIDWLVLNRRGGHWQNTRETAFAVIALTRALAARASDDPDTEVALVVNHSPVARIQATPKSLLAGGSTIEIDPGSLRSGANLIELRRTRGDALLYAVAVASSWAHGDHVRSAAHHVALDRSYTRQKAQPTLAGTVRFEPETLAPGASVLAGEELRAHITLNTPTDLEYVMVEVPKPAGCEPLGALSGWDARLVRPDEEAKKRPGKLPPTAHGRPIYREEHDDRSVFFLESLPPGVSEIRFSLRATTPGDFQTLPAVVEAMYVPEIRANSATRRLRIAPRGAED